MNPVDDLLFVAKANLNRNQRNFSYPYDKSHSVLSPLWGDKSVEVTLPDRLSPLSFRKSVRQKRSMKERISSMYPVSGFHHEYINSICININEQNKYLCQQY